MKLLLLGLFVPLSLLLQTAPPAPAPQPPPTAPPAQPASAPKYSIETISAGPAGAQQPAPASQPDYATGPLRADIQAVYEPRIRLIEPVPGAPTTSELRMQFRLSGEAILKVARMGNLIFDEAVDDTGKSLIAADTYSPEDRTALRPINMPAERVRTTGLTFMARLSASARGAKAIRSLKGSMKLVVADAAETVTVENPIQFLGKTIDNKRLKELGVQIRIASPTEFEPAHATDKAMALQFQSRREQVKSMAFFDGSMKAVRHRESEATTKDGQKAALLQIAAGALTDETQLVLEVYPKLEDVTLPVELKDVELP